MISRLLAAGLACVLSGCASSGKSQVKHTVDPERQADFDRGLKALDSEQYGQAAEIFDRLLVQKPATEFDLVTLYNSAAAYQGLGECNKAADRYRQVKRIAVRRPHNPPSQVVVEFQLFGVRQVEPQTPLQRVAKQLFVRSGNGLGRWAENAGAAEASRTRFHRGWPGLRNAGCRFRARKAVTKPPPVRI